MVGGESRKSRRPFAVADFNAPAKSCRAPGWTPSKTSSKNTNLKGLTSLIVRNIPNNEASWHT